MLATSATRLDVRAGDLCRCFGTSAPTQVPGESDQPITGPSARGGYSLSKSIYDLRTSTRAPYVFAAPVRGRKVVYPRGCTARPVSRLRTAVSSADRVESLGF